MAWRSIDNRGAKQGVHCNGANKGNPLTVQLCVSVVTSAMDHFHVQDVGEEKMVRANAPPKV
jgi:hypothetical protein